LVQDQEVEHLGKERLPLKLAGIAECAKLNLVPGDIRGDKKKVFGDGPEAVK
jgi:hypothetical protein